MDEKPGLLDRFRRRTKHASRTIHAAELGQYVGALSYLLLFVGPEAASVAGLVVLVRLLVSQTRANGLLHMTTLVNHRLGWHDIRQRPGVFVGSFLVGFGTPVISEFPWRFVFG